jgi:protein-S-isoprenylcysteine O-methyltransferase Ste14
MRVRRIVWVLFKTGIFTVVAPLMVGLVLPRHVHWAFVPTDTALVPARAILLSQVFLGAGAAMYLWCAWDFAVKGMGTPAPIDAPRKLVVKGLYRFVRNPMYLSVLCLVLSQALTFFSLPILVYFVFIVACFHLFVIVYEEPHLRNVFGERYEDYCRMVPRWLPRLGSRHARSA